MNLQKILIRLILIIFLVNYFAMVFHWYSSIWYLDMPMHFLGGVWISLAIIWFSKIKEMTLSVMIKIILGVLFIGFLWEIFEMLVNDYTIKNLFNLLDTSSDICFDIAGGLFGIFFYLKKIMSIEVNVVQ